MLGFEDGRASVGMHPVLEVRFIVIGKDVVYLQALGPGIHQPFLRALKVVFDVALTADIGPHLLARSHGIDVVVLDALRRFEGTYAFKEARVV